MSLRYHRLRAPATAFTRQSLRLLATASHTAAPSSPTSSPTTTPSLLESHLAPLITMRGPLTVSDFMMHALLHPTMGYYTTVTPDDQIFGSRGDFTTAPEISQLFGELIGVWIVSTWHAMGCPSSLRLVELGPGRGTLASDVLRTVSQFPSFYNSVASLHLVERSEALRNVQHENLSALVEGGSVPPVAGEDGDGLPVPTFWHDEFSSVPEDGPCIVIAQELFDALPVHQFEYTDQGWCERLVDVDMDVGLDDVLEAEAGEAGEHQGVARGGRAKTGADACDEASADAREVEHGPELRFVLSPAPTNASRVYIRMFEDIAAEAAGMPGGGGAGVGMTTAPPASEPVRLPASAGADSLSSISSSPALGSRLEVCPAGCALAQDIAQRVEAHGGAALIVDYGKDGASADSLRGIRNHEFVSPLVDPGKVDLSADVDFASLRAAVESLPGERLRKRGRNDGNDGGRHQSAATVHGTVGQGEFLKNMGVETRLHALLTGGHLDEAQQEALFASYLRLTDPEEMGNVYRVMAIVSGAGDGPMAGFVPPGSGASD
jgi:NADH dehydrogenase [ubiquinone] 1 alpha subcomplex assembly factor 7